VAPTLAARQPVHQWQPEHRTHRAAFHAEQLVMRGNGCAESMLQSGTYRGYVRASAMDRCHTK
jgi:hypothetical protein